MPTVRDAISLVRTKNKLLSSDNVISDRAVEKDLKNNAMTLIRRETNVRKLWSTSTIFNEIPCLEMENVPLSECCALQSDEMISRSKYKLPSILEGIYGYLVQWVMNTKKTQSFDYVSRNRFINYAKMNPPKRMVCWFIDNRYLYITQEDVQIVSISAYFEDNIPKKLLFPDCECSHKINYDECKNPLDLQFKCPGYLQGPAIDMTVKSLLDSYFRIEPDRTSDEKSDEKRES